MTILSQLNLTKTDLIQYFKRANILIVGDVMLDQYWFGDSTRISPEAPVPIAKIEHKEQRAGGAANVARNVASLGGLVTLLSVTGDDPASIELEELLNNAKVQHHLVKDKHISTTIKLRVIARNQQLIRLDFEETPRFEILNQISQAYSSMINDFDVIILSDYGKGGLTHVKEFIALARRLNKPILVDPKGSDYSKYKGATMITPNQSELKSIIGSWQNEQELEDKTQILRNQLDLNAILLTRSEDGLSLFKDKQISHQLTESKEVFDVSGAGDTVIATIALAYAAGLEDYQAMKIANIAAGVVVGKVGTATCSIKELIDILETKIRE